MNQRTDCTIRRKRGLQATGCLLMAVAALVHFWCCEWRVSFQSQNGEPDVSDFRHIVGPIYPKESFPGNVWEAGMAGLMLPGSLVLVGLIIVALADNPQPTSIRGREEIRKTSVPLVCFVQARRLPYESTPRVSSITTARPLATRSSGPEQVAATDSLDRRSQHYVVCPSCNCFLIVQRDRARRSFQCPFCTRSFTLGYSEISQSHELATAEKKVSGLICAKHPEGRFPANES